MLSLDGLPHPNALIYGLWRYSTDEQGGDGATSEVRQIGNITGYCEQVFGRAPDRWIEDPGVTAIDGHNLRHGRIAQFRRDVEDGVIPAPLHLVIEGVDRLTRAPVNMANAFTSALIQAGVILHVARRGLVVHASDPNAIMNLLPLLIDAEASNRDNVARSANVQRNVDLRRAAAVAGESTFMDWGPGWVKPQRLVGSEWQDVQSQGRGARRLPGERRFVWRSPEHHRTLLRICELSAEGHGGEVVAQMLNIEGHAPWGRAAMWHPEAIVNITRSESLIGRYTPHKTVRDGVTPSGRVRKRREATEAPIQDYYPAIPVDLWQRMLAARRATSKKNPGRHSPRVANLFAGLCRCGLCGASMQTTGNDARGYALICRAKRAAKCANTRHSLTRVEQAILKDDNLSLIRRALRVGDAEAAQAVEPLARDLAGLDAELVRLDRQITNLTSSIRDALSEAERKLDHAERRAVMATKEEVVSARDELVQQIEDARATAPERAMIEAELLARDALEGDVVARKRLAAIMRTVMDRIDFANGRAVITLAKAKGTKLIVEKDGRVPPDWMTRAKPVADTGGA